MTDHSPHITEKDLLISRQVIEGIFTSENQEQLKKTNICIVGLQGLGTEIVKNLSFLGVQKIFLCDDSEPKIQDKTFNIFLHEQQINQNVKLNRSKVCQETFNQFQKNTDYQTVSQKNLFFNKNFLIENEIAFVIVADFVFPSLRQLFELNEMCKTAKVGFIFAYSSIIFSFLFYCIRDHHQMLEHYYGQKFQTDEEIFLKANFLSRDKEIQSIRTYAIFKFFEEKQQLPQYLNSQDQEFFEKILQEEIEQTELKKFKNEEPVQNKKLSFYIAQQFIVVQSFWAPFIVNCILEKIKFPNNCDQSQIQQMIGWQDYQLIKQDFEKRETISENDQFLTQKIIFGVDLFEKIQNGKYLIAGCGATGSEQTKLLTLLGMGQNNGSLTLIDNDTIEVSNLNRQMFYTKQDNKKNKSEVLSSKINRLNNINCIAQVGYLNESNEEKFFNFDKFSELNLIICCFDNVAGRKYLSQMARRTFTCLIDSATLNFLAQSQIQVPYITLTIKFAVENTSWLKSIPKCTISSKHKNPLEAIAWCKYFFENEFTEVRKEGSDSNIHLKNSDISKLQNDGVYIHNLRQICERISNEISEEKKLKYQNEFIYYLAQVILDMIEPDLTLEYSQFINSTEDQQILIQNQNIQIRQFEFDKSNLKHLNLLYYMTHIRCELYQLDTPDSLFIMQKAGEINGALITSTSQSAATSLLEYFKYEINKQSLKQHRNSQQELNQLLKSIHFKNYDIEMNYNFTFKSLILSQQFHKTKIKQNISLKQLIEKYLNDVIIDEIYFYNSYEKLIIFDSKMRQNELYEEEDIKQLEEFYEQDLQSLCQQLEVPLRMKKYHEFLIQIVNENEEISKQYGAIHFYPSKSYCKIES